MRKILLLLLVLLGCTADERPLSVALPAHDPVGAALALAPAPAPESAPPPVSTTTAHYHAAAVEAQVAVTPTTHTPTPGSSYQRFERLADCESGDREWRGDRWYFFPGTARWDLSTGNGYYGGLQFSAATWRQAGGTGLPHQHPKDHQIAIAESWLARTSWAQWPECSRDLGYR